MKAFLIALSVIIVLVIAFATLIFANKGEDKFSAEYLAQGASPSSSASASPVPSVSPSTVPSPEPSVTPAPSPSPTPSPSPSPYDGPVNPLTGLPAAETIVNNRPVAIMINNLSKALPQLGVSKADIIYEILVEGGITRMMAVFQDVSNAGEIGSIRSARPYFVAIADGYDAIYIHAGGSSDAYSALKSTNITHLDGVNGKKQDIFYRDKARQKTMGTEHSLVTTSALIEKFLPKYGISLVHPGSFKNTMTFADSAVPAGDKTAASVTVHYSSTKTTTFKYSESDSVYNISQHGSAYIDGNDNTKISVTNVLVLKTDVSVISGDTAGRITVDTVGSGTGIFMSGGKYEEIKWSRKNNSSQFIFTLGDGTPIVFGRGKTYICIIDTKNAVDFK